MDLLPGTPYNQQIANCCKGGVMNSWVQDPGNAASSFQISVGAAGTTNKTVRVPRNFTLLGPGPGYTCGPAKIVKPTKFVTPDTRRTTQAMSKYHLNFSYNGTVNVVSNLTHSSFFLNLPQWHGTLLAHTHSSLLKELRLAAFLYLLFTMKPLSDVQLVLADAKTTKRKLVLVSSECSNLFLFISNHYVSNFAASGSISNRKVSNFFCNGSPDTPHLASVVSPPTKKGTILPPLVQCTRHMCPIRVHWHVKQNYKEYWRVKITITNFNYRLNYSQWNMVAQHPNLDNITQIFSFNYKSLTPYAGLSKHTQRRSLVSFLSLSVYLKDWNFWFWVFADDTAMLWGVKFYNDFLSEAGPLGNVQSEILFRKDQSTFTFEKGWAFPRRIYFNGDNCVMPPPDTYPFLPNGGFRSEFSVFAAVFLPVLVFFFFFSVV